MGYGEHHDLVRDFGGPRPTITVLCGSTRFRPTAFQEANLRLTVAGHIVLSIGCDTKSDDDLDLAAQAADGRSLEQVKTDLDELHKRKIDLADEVLVLNVGGYIGQSTRSEIAYAEQLGRPVRYLEQTECGGDGCPGCAGCMRSPNGPPEVTRSMADMLHESFGDGRQLLAHLADEAAG